MFGERAGWRRIALTEVSRFAGQRQRTQVMVVEVTPCVDPQLEGSSTWGRGR